MYYIFTEGPENKVKYMITGQPMNLNPIKEANSELDLPSFIALLCTKFGFLPCLFMVEHYEED